MRKGSAKTTRKAGQGIAEVLPMLAELKLVEKAELPSFAAEAGHRG